MPVIVIGADTPLGASVLAALGDRDGEVRAFVTDVAVAERLRARGIKTAVGDVSDGSHVGGAALGCFCAVVIPEAALDDRERSFSDSPTATLQGWADALADAGVHRMLWFEDPRVPAPTGSRFPEFALIATGDRSLEDLGSEAARLDDLAELDA
jgi:hypothetical protein